MPRNALQRSLGLFQVNTIGLGCMVLSHAYGTPLNAEQAGKLLNRALDIGYTHLDTAALYGFGANEELLGTALKGRRHEFVLASKCGIFKNRDGQREINGHPDQLIKTCEDSLRRLQTEVIDLYYLHRWDKRIPIEDSVGTLGNLVRQGKLRSIGLSEVSADTLHKAHCEHPISALQNEFSLWSRNAEIAALQTCKRLGIAFVAFSPLGRGFLTDQPPLPDNLLPHDIRKAMPRFTTDHYAKNLRLLQQLQKIAKRQGITTAQLALAWVLSQGDHIVAIPGTTCAEHLSENAAACDIELDAKTLAELESLFQPDAISGKRYPDNIYTEIDSEDFQ